MFNYYKFFKSVYQTKLCRLCLRMASQGAPKVVNNSKYKMQAWQIHSYGGFEELQLTTARIPHITNPDELLIQVKAASLNPIDMLMMTGYGSSALNFLRGNELEFPLTLGREFSGIISNKGHGVNEFEVGQSVYGIIPFHKQGSHAEYIITDKSQVLLQPTVVSAVEAASVLFASLTAWSALFITGELALRNISSAKVLILGVSSSVGIAATQILKSQLAQVVGTCATDAVPLVQSVGADHVYDYSKEEHVLKVGSHGVYDIILDCAKKGYKNIPVEWKYNKYVTLDSTLGNNLDKFGLTLGTLVSVGDIAAANFDSFKKGQSVRWGFFLPISDGLNFINKLISRKQLLPVIHKTFKFNEIPDAYKMMSAGHLRGKIVIDMQ